MASFRLGDAARSIEAKNRRARNAEGDRHAEMQSSDAMSDPSTVDRPQTRTRTDVQIVSGDADHHDDGVDDNDAAV